MKTSTISVSKLFTLLGGLVVLASAPASQAQELNFQNYNAIIFNNLSTNSTIEGRTFVGNDFTGTGSANLGNSLPNSIGSADRSFVVGGDIVSGSHINLQRGSVYLDGSGNNRPINFNGGGSVVADHSIDASTAAIREYSIAQSAGFRNMVADSVVSLPSGQHGPITFNATGGADGVAVFNVSGADIFSNSLAQQMQLNVDAFTTSIVINVSGTSINWSNNGNMNGNFNDNYWQANILWNFYEATDIALGSKGFNGTILAPLASITSSGQIDGLVVAENITTTGAIRLPDSNSPIAYNGTLAPVPEPGSAVFLLSAGAFVIFVRNRRLLT